MTFNLVHLTVCVSQVSFSLKVTRYALSKGAAAFAVDIEESTHLGESESPKSNLKLTQHHVQRRSECGELKEGTTGSFLILDSANFPWKLGCMIVASTSTFQAPPSTKSIKVVSTFNSNLIIVRA